MSANSPQSFKVMAYSLGMMGSDSGDGIRTIVYSPVVLDLFHFGHLQALKFGKEKGDMHIVGLMSDEVVSSYKQTPIALLEERQAIAENLRSVDEVMLQFTKDPTPNLKIIHGRYPHAKILLLYGEKWKEHPGKEYVESIGGEVITHAYYARLSDFKIMERFVSTYKEGTANFEDFTNYFQIKGMASPKRHVKSTIISTKANTLRTLAPLLTKSFIEKSYVFTVKEWVEESEALIAQIMEKFSSKSLVIRSSTLDEDTLSVSNAGMFHSELHVATNADSIRASVEKVINSYKEKNSLSSTNQVLVQEQTEGIVNSGVVFTRVMGSNAPYYVINFDDSTGLSDTVTKGTHCSSIKISRFSSVESIPEQFQGLLEAVKEIEEIIPQMSLDMEFAINGKGEVVIFQVRPIAVNRDLTVEKDDAVQSQVQVLKQQFFELSKEKQHIHGRINCFGDMPDWNPAEILGSNPGYLDYSLYDYIITNSVWAEARQSQGYKDVLPAQLVHLFGNKPYIDVRNSFNSFLPKGLSPEVETTLVDFYMEKLRF